MRICVSVFIYVCMSVGACLYTYGYILVCLSLPYPFSCFFYFGLDLELTNLYFFKLYIVSFDLYLWRNKPYLRCTRTVRLQDSLNISISGSNASIFLIFCKKIFTDGDQKLLICCIQACEPRPNFTRLTRAIFKQYYVCIQQKISENHINFNISSLIYKNSKCKHWSFLLPTVLQW